ncbi:MAG TPA: hypothetical protein VGV35_19145 [Bryobacteraceae bacterium]|nr:hypothetical protein [Bryobacteraceae bacterium]
MRWLRNPTFHLPAVPAWLVRLTGGAFLLAYFLCLAWNGLHSRFIRDDPSNLYYYWSRGAGPLIRAQFEFFTTYYRPMGGLFYLPIYSLGGWDPLPYRAVALFIILLNTALVYRVAKLLSGSAGVGWLAAFLAAYHPRVMDIVYENAKIYDVLCFLFYFAALAWYLGIRARGQFCNWRQTAVFIALYICALNSKEMAVTLPLTLVLYELLFHPPIGINVKTLWAWVTREGRIAAIAGLLTAVYVFGKTIGPDPLIQIEGYRPEFTVEKFMNSITSNLQDLFYLPDWFGPWHIVGAWAALLAFAWFKKSGYVAFCVLFAISSELPIAFIGRAWSCLYIPLAAWAMLVSASVWAAAELASSVFRPRAVRRAVAALLVAVFVLWNATYAWSEKQRLEHYFFEVQGPTWSAIQQFTKFKIDPKPGSRIAFLHDPLPSPTALYLARLRFQNPNLDVVLRADELPASAFSDIDFIFDYQNGEFVQIKPPNH